MRPRHSRPARLQGYAYDARLRCARLAREIWKDEALAVKLETQAADLKRRFNQDFWIPDRRFFALALDGHKRKVDSLCSNIGLLLWSGIVDDDKARALRDHLMSPQMFSGWGIRTMAVGEGGYNPIEYHNGTVWPHDCSFIAAGLARYGFRQDAATIIAGLFEASWFFNCAFAGSLLWLRSREHTVPRAIPHGLYPSGVGRRVADARHPHLARPGTEG